MKIKIWENSFDKNAELFQKKYDEHNVLKNNELVLIEISIEVVIIMPKKALE